MSPLMSNIETIQRFMSSLLSDTAFEIPPIRSCSNVRTMLVTEPATFPRLKMKLSAHLELADKTLLSVKISIILSFNRPREFLILFVFSSIPPQFTPRLNPDLKSFASSLKRLTTLSIPLFSKPSLLFSKSESADTSLLAFPVLTLGSPKLIFPSVSSLPVSSLLISSKPIRAFLSFLPVFSALSPNPSLSEVAFEKSVAICPIPLASFC